MKLNAESSEKKTERTPDLQVRL